MRFYKSFSEDLKGGKNNNNKKTKKKEKYFQTAAVIERIRGTMQMRRRVTPEMVFTI